jgi:uncharacterized membrane protein YfcA
MRGQGRRVLILMPAAIAGGLIGGVLILNSSEKTFQLLVPWLLIGSCALLWAQDHVRAWLQRRSGVLGLRWAIVPVLLAAIYGGYFGAGLSVIYLSVLGLTLDDSLTRLNGLKQALGLATNVAAALLFVASPRMDWPAALVMGVGAIVGGTLGGRLASVIAPATLRLIVTLIGVGVAVLFLIRA